jgi:phage anti-repressor protein
MMSMPEEVRQSMSEAVVKSARDHFDLQRQATNYLEWFQELIDEF